MESSRIVETFAERLEGRAFEGFYADRRLVGASEGTLRPEYCAAVLLPACEADFAEDLRLLASALAAKCPRVSPRFEDGSPPRLLARLESRPLGYYWFLLRSVRLDDDRLVFDLHALRHFPDRSFPESAELPASPSPPLEFNARLLIDAFRFASVVVAASVVGAFKVIEFLGDFTPRLIRETAFFVEKSTPMFYGALNFLGRFTSAVLAFFVTIVRGNRPIRVSDYAPVRYDYSVQEYNSYGNRRRDENRPEI